MRHFKVHISRSKNVMTLSSMKERTKEILRSNLTRFNVAAATAHKPDPLVILMTTVLEAVNKTDFKIVLERNPQMDLMEFYHEAERYLRQKNAEADNTNVNVVDDEEPPK